MDAEDEIKRKSVWHWVTGTFVLVAGYTGSLLVISFLVH